ncbi:hypothetical protein fugu_015219 [Takifugu bimaculatus]|uniref:Uncharacterized protein n=1 Tax=Takifugu bimaculatus TaxID=433685 RepID=A0A4Z2BY51_9TELE|nr:hypothetical protein fugu_015219 [Takifugu bimaculatus]
MVAKADNIWDVCCCLPQGVRGRKQPVFSSSSDSFAGGAGNYLGTSLGPGGYGAGLGQGAYPGGAVGKLGAALGQSAYPQGGYPQGNYPQGFGEGATGYLGAMGGYGFGYGNGHGDGNGAVLEPILGRSRARMGVLEEGWKHLVVNMEPPRFPVIRRSLQHWKVMAVTPSQRSSSASEAREQKPPANTGLPRGSGHSKQVCWEQLRMHLWVSQLANILVSTTPLETDTKASSDDPDFFKPIASTVSSLKSLFG